MNFFDKFYIALIFLSTLLHYSRGDDGSGTLLISVPAIVGICVGILIVICIVGYCCCPALICCGFCKNLFSGGGSSGQQQQQQSSNVVSTNVLQAPPVTPNQAFLQQPPQQPYQQPYQRQQSQGPEDRDGLSPLPDRGLPPPTERGPHPKDRRDFSKVLDDLPRDSEEFRRDHGPPPPRDDQKPRSPQMDRILEQRDVSLTERGARESASKMSLIRPVTSDSSGQSTDSKTSGEHHPPTTYRPPGTT